MMFATDCYFCLGLLWDPSPTLARPAHTHPVTIQCVTLGMDADRRTLERERKVKGVGVMTATISTTYPALRTKDHLPLCPSISCR